MRCSLRYLVSVLFRLRWKLLWPAAGLLSWALLLSLCDAGMGCCCGLAVLRVLSVWRRHGMLLWSSCVACISCVTQAWDVAVVQPCCVYCLCDAGIGCCCGPAVLRSCHYRSHAPDPPLCWVLLQASTKLACNDTFSCHRMTAQPLHSSHLLGTSALAGYFIGFINPHFLMLTSRVLFLIMNAGIR